MAAATAELTEWRELVTETVEQLKVAQDDVVLRFSLCEASREEMDVHTIEVTVLQERLAAKSAELLQL